LRTVRRICDVLEPIRDGANGIVPRDALELTFSFPSYAPQRIEEPVAVVDAVEVVGHFLAEEALGKWMLRVAAKLDGATVLHRDDQPARIGAVVGTNGPDGGEGLLDHCFGLNAFTTLSFVVKYGPSIKSMQYGIAGKTAIKQSRIALGLPGRLTISDFPRIPATCRDRIAVGTTFSETARICSPKPSSIFSQTASVASGVTSRFAGPVPPVVTIRQHPSVSARSFSVFSMTGRSSGMSRGTGSHRLERISVKQSRMAGPPLSS